MATVAILSVYKHLKDLKPRRVAFVTKNIRPIMKRIDGEDQVVDEKLEQREQIFLNQLQKRCIDHVHFTAPSLMERIKEFTAKPRFEMCVISGEPVYQLFLIASRIRDARFSGSIFLELREDDAEKEAILKTAERNAKTFKVPELLRNLVCLTMSPKEASKHLDFDIPELSESATVQTKPKKLKRALTGPLIPAADISEPPDRIEIRVSRINRDTATARALKHRYDFKCQICSTRIKLSDDAFYAEVHHIRPLGGPHNGLDVLGNMPVLCPNHHAMFDFRSSVFHCA